MAEQTVDRLVGSDAPKSRTARLPLVGAAPRHVLQAIRAPARLVRRYGAEAPAVAALADRAPELLAPVAPGIPALGVEFAFGIEHEGALTATDLLDRRVRLGLVPAERAAAHGAAERMLQRMVAEPAATA